MMHRNTIPRRDSTMAIRPSIGNQSRDLGNVFSSQQLHEESTSRSFGEPRISHTIDIELSEDHMDGQFERLAQLFDMDDEEMGVFKAAVIEMANKKAEQMGKEWSEEVVEAVANLLVAMYIQEENQRLMV